VSALRFRVYVGARFFEFFRRLFETNLKRIFGLIFWLIEKLTHSSQYFVEFRCLHLSNRVKNQVVFKCEKSLRTNEAWLTHPAAFTIAGIQWNGERIPVCVARDLAEN